jgi:hypothetical protein
MMRAVMVLVGGSLAVFVLGAALLVTPGARRHEAVPQGATDVRVEGWRQVGNFTCQRVSYHLPPDWSLLDQYAFLRAHGLGRDATIDQALRRTQQEWQSSTFAIFVRQGWLGLLNERATVSIGMNGHPRPQVNVERCIKTNPWMD